MKLKTQYESTAICAAKSAALLVGATSTAFMVVKFAVPFSRDLVASTLPAFWASARGYLSPPYLFVTLNFIILTIWKLSENAHLVNEHSPEATTLKPPKQVAAVDHHRRRPSSPGKPYDGSWQPPSPFHGEVHVYQPPVTGVAAAKSPESHPEIHFDSRITTNSDENPPDPSPKSCRRNANRASLTPVAPTVAVNHHEPEPVPQSLDATWLAITGGGARPAMKKSETWDVPPTVEVPAFPPTARAEMTKSETFMRRVAAEPPARALRAEPLLSGHVDELNRRVEAFIKKVNDQIRLPQQETHQRTVEIMNKGY